jgi:hypothetical protein
MSLQPNGARIFHKEVWTGKFGAHALNTRDSHITIRIRGLRKRAVYTIILSQQLSLPVTYISSVKLLNAVMICESTRHA